MEPCPGRTDQVGQPALDVHVQVFESRVPRKFAPLDLLLHRREPADYRVGIFPGDDALRRQHVGMGL